MLKEEGVEEDFSSGSEEEEELAVEEEDADADAVKEEEGEEDCWMVCSVSGPIIALRLSRTAKSRGVLSSCLRTKHKNQEHIKKTAEIEERRTGDEIQQRLTNIKNKQHWQRGTLLLRSRALCLSRRSIIASWLFSTAI
jgi:hypothetical protein